MKIEYPVITTKTAELKGCPFCGNDTNLSVREDGCYEPQYYIFCNKCGVRGPFSNDIQWIITKWNTRQGEVIKNDRQGITDVVGAIPGRC